VPRLRICDRNGHYEHYHTSHEEEAASPEKTPCRLAASFVIETKKCQRAIVIRVLLLSVFRPVNARGEVSPHYAMRVQFRGRRLAFTLGTGNKEAAAKGAAACYGELLARGIEATLARYRVQKHEKPTEVAAVGEWIAATEKVFDGKPSSFAGYARALRLIAAEIAKVKKTKARYGRGGGDYRRAADSIQLSMLTPEAIQSWRIAYVKNRGVDNPAKQRAARITCNSLLRLARSLFSPGIRKFIPNLLLPDPIPFKGVAFYPRESMRYQSKIDPAILLSVAQAKLASANYAKTDEHQERLKREAFKVLVLALGAGLRRGEIDRLLWRQVDLKAGIIRIEATEVGDLKTEDSSREVAIDGTLSSLLQGFKARATSQYVIEGMEEDIASARAWGHAYRCTPVFDFLTAWLRKQGVEGNKPLHTLRKEAGAMIATKKGIYAASRFLRHADIQVTAMHYADYKERVTVDMGALLQPANETKLVPMPDARKYETRDATPERKKST
jgi:integrase